jgi:phosphate transport system permease protein
MTDHSTEQRFRRRAVEERSIVDDDSRTPAEPAPAVLGARPEEYAVAAAAAEPDVDDVPAGVPANLSGGTRRLGDRLFAGVAGGASGIVILIVVLVAVFLLIKAGPSIADDKANFLTSTKFNVGRNGTLEFGIAGLLYTTVLSSLVALLLAVPLAIGIALFITQYAPRRVSQPIAHAIDLLAAIPSIIYGVWGIRVLAPHLTPIQHALSHIGLGLFANQNIDVGTVFDAGETIAVLLILSTVSGFSFSLFSGGSTFASKIVQGQGEFGTHPGPYIAAGLVLFVLTFLVNALARSIVARRKDFV